MAKRPIDNVPRQISRPRDCPCLVQNVVSSNVKDTCIMASSTVGVSKQGSFTALADKA